MEKETLPTPLIIKKEEALLRRILTNHKKRGDIMENLRKAWSGFRGEENLHYHLSFLPKKDFIVLSNVRLVTQKKTFQMDALVLTPYFILIVESKNFSGTLFFDQISKQFIRMYQNQEDGFPDPIKQVIRQKTNLAEWMAEKKLKPCPIEYLIAVSNPSTIIKTNPGKEEIFQKILHAEHIPEKILVLTASYEEKSISPYLIQKLTQVIKQEQSPLSIDILEKYDIHPSEILQGTFCPFCYTLPMQRIQANWYCPTCKSVSKNAHEQSILEYLYLFDSMTNKQCRQFLDVSSIQTCTCLLEKMNLPSTGKGKSKVYLPPET